MIVPASDIRVILSTAASREEAERIARALLDQQLAACVNVVAGVRSLYRWKGAIEQAEEVLLLIKTSAGLLDTAASVLRSAHSYEIPELLVFTPESGGADYVDWLMQSVGPPE